jgi:energy-coupling factor transporter ATP-binding protein EcfA2
MHTNYTLFETYEDTQYTKIFFDAETGGFVVAHREHGKYELAGNKTIALLLVKHGYRVVLLENQHNVVSADVTIDDEAWEFKTVAKTVSMSNAIQRHITRGKRQASNILVFINQVYKVLDVTKGIHNAVKFDEKKLVKRIGILFQDGHLIFMERTEVMDESFIDKFYPKIHKGG